MTSEPEKGRRRRIAVALDASAQSLRVMGLAATIAAAMEAELEGVFVEDADLLRLAGLPFLREFRLATRRENTVDRERLQRELRATARWVRESLERSASQRGCAWSFRIWRGDLGAEILSAALDAEMFTLSPIGRFAPFYSRPSAQPQLGRDTEFVVSVLFNGNEGAARALAAAADLGARHKAALCVLLQAAGPSAMRKLRDRADALLGKARGRVRYLPLQQGDSEALARAVRAVKGDLLVVDSTNDLLGRQTLWQSLGALQCPLLIVR